MIYHPGWFAMMILSLIMTAMAPASSSKSAIMFSYFMLWSGVGPLIHVLLPAAGPVFYERMGYGTSFQGLDGGSDTAAVADYLWSIYASGSSGAGRAISAMPLMHVTISSWTVIASYVSALRWLPATCVAWLVVFLLSISLGWHYALDGIVGTAAALTCHLALFGIFHSKPALPFHSGRERLPKSAIAPEALGLVG